LKIGDTVEDEVRNAARYHASPGKRKKNLFRRILKKILILVFIVCVLWLFFIFVFRMTNVNIQGNTRYSDADVMEMVNLNGDIQNTVLYYLKYKDVVIDDVPFVESISIKWGGPNTINVYVVEKSIVGCIEVGDVYMYFDNTGEIIEGSATRQTDIPLVGGLGSDDAAPGDVIEVADNTIFEDLLNLNTLLSEFELEPLKVMIQADMTMVLNLGNVQVMLGNSDNLSDKIAAIKDLESQLEGRTGVLHLENYDSTKDSIIFSEES